MTIDQIFKEKHQGKGSNAMSPMNTTICAQWDIYRASRCSLPYHLCLRSFLLKRKSILLIICYALDHHTEKSG